MVRTEYQLWEKCKPLIQKILEKILSDKKAQKTFMDYAVIKELEISYVNFSAAAGNHAFDDKPEIFGITKLEGHTVRSYFQYDGMGTEMPDNKSIFEEMVLGFVQK